MPSNHWEQIENIFLAVADLPREEQAAFLDNACRDDNRLRQEVQSLLDSDRKSGEKITRAVEDEAQSLFGLSPIIGSRLGSYRVIREIGRGGMGAVYLATRDDDQFQKKVAIKLVKRGMDTAEVLARFRHERQILANLDHPYISRLLDGGTSGDGRPFFVMDYAEGQPLDVYCREQNLDIPARCQLFLRILEAVAHAHRHLVVHRDLKPGNILVTADGVPKLLDFGVAKLWSEDGERTPTVTGAMRTFTPEYASPEQVRGLPVTTVADIYALGAVLYELLTGQRAQTIAAFTPLEIDRAICEAEVRRPSLVVANLDADFDNIVAMAMRKEPERRYQSVDQLAEDIRRHLDGRPVMARQGAWAYRARKFVRRNRAGIAGAALLITVLIGATASATIQARRAIQEQARAEQESRSLLESQARAESSRKYAEQQTTEAGRQREYAESQRKQAELQRQRAEHRFEQVRQLAGKFLLEFHDSIAKLPGSIAARKMVVETGLQYYDTLVKEAHGNRDLLEEIARGYDRLGDVQGGQYQSNLGNSAAAIASYEKALAVRAKISDPSPEFLRDRMDGNVRLAQVLVLKGDLKAGSRMLRETILLGRQGPTAQSYIVRTALANAYRGYGDMCYQTGEFDPSIEPYSRVLEIYTQLARENLHPQTEQENLSLAHAKLADAYAGLYRHPESLAHVRIAIEIDKKLVAANRNNTSLLRKLFVDYSLLSNIFRADESLAAPGAARGLIEEEVTLADQMLAADPGDTRALNDVMIAETILGDWLRDHKDPEAALGHYRKMITNVEKFSAAGAPALFAYQWLIFSHQRLASGFGRIGQLEEALQHCQKAEEYADQAEKLSPGQVEITSRRAYIDTTRADAYVRHKRWVEAIAALRAAGVIFADLRKRVPGNLGFLSQHMDVFMQLADCQAAVEQWSSAIEATETALKLLDEIQARRPLRREEMDKRKAALSNLDEFRKMQTAR